ncbi:MAG: toxin-antitoxin system HicB family antitoxin [Pyrinomonadaceae bacterium]
MSAIENLFIPESLLKQVRKLAEKEGITIEQFISSAMAEKAAAWMTVEYLEQRAGRGSRQKFLQALSHVPDAEPVEQDRLD